MSKHSIVVSEELARKRIDKLIAELYPQYPRAALHRLFASEHILLNDQATRPGIKVRVNDAISIDLSPLNFDIESLDLPIIYENDDVLVIDKPSGVISHARGRFFDEASVASFLREHVFGKSSQTPSQQLRAGIVHRLDRATSGVMVCAKNESTMQLLQKQFADRTVEKTYLAIVEGKLPTTEGIIDMPLQRNPQKPQTFRAHPDGKPSQTEYQVISQNEKYSLVRLKPLTGRTHQLRIHLAELKHPIVGDDFYGGSEAPRLLLHANTIQIKLPDGKLKTFTAEMPELFKEYI